MSQSSPVLGDAQRVQHYCDGFLARWNTARETPLGVPRRSTYARYAFGLGP
jgi:hypothetical protein